MTFLKSRCATGFASARQKKIRKRIFTGGASGTLYGSDFRCQSSEDVVMQTFCVTLQPELNSLPEVEHATGSSGEGVP